MLRHLPAIIGGMSLVFFGILAFLNKRSLDLGMIPKVGATISVILLFSGLWSFIPYAKRKLYLFVLLVIYTSGILFMGLRARPGNTNGHQPATMLVTSGIIGFDAALNIIGFIPLAFLSVMVFQHGRLFRKSLFRFSFGFTFCLSLSFFIEIFQFYIVGRSSSLVDVVTNGVGAILGCGYGLLYTKLWNQFSRKIVP
jgi:VanZ family protein